MEDTDAERLSKKQRRRRKWKKRSDRGRQGTGKQEKKIVREEREE